MDYSKMSDGEIGRRVAAACKLEGGANYNGKTLIVKNGVWATFDPCNIPADAWSIILNSRISMVWDCAEDASAAWWNAFDQFDECRIEYQSNPLRAAMIVYLMMQDSSNAPANPTRSDIR